MKTEFELEVDAAWREFITRHPYAGKTHEVVFRFAYYKALNDLALKIHKMTAPNDDLTFINNKDHPAS